jgi:hypothetical protein
MLIWVLFLSVSAQITPPNTQRGIIPAAEPDNVALGTDSKLTQLGVQLQEQETKVKTRIN